MVPPVSPVLAVMLVTVPLPPPVELIVIFPVDAEMLMPGPAFRLRTPVLLTVTLPTVLETLMPKPAMMPVIREPEELIERVS
jgi:hypothetical protein